MAKDEKKQRREPEPDPEYDWIPVSKWQFREPGGSELAADIEDLRALEELYELLRKDGPMTEPAFRKGMEFLQKARETLRVQIAISILVLHSAVPEPEPEDLVSSPA